MIVRIFCINTNYIRQLREFFYKNKSMIVLQENVLVLYYNNYYTIKLLCDGYSSMGNNGLFIHFNTRF